MSEVEKPADEDGEAIPILIDEETFKYIEKIVPKIAAKYFPRRIQRDDLVQKVLAILVNKPPIWRPAKGASRETFIYQCVSCDLINLINPTRKEERVFRQAPEAEVVRDKAGQSHVEDVLQSGKTASDFVAPKVTEDEILEHIVGEENQRLCRAYMKFNGNATKTAKEIGVSDKTVRRKLERLLPSLVKAGFEPPPKLQEEHHLYVRVRGPGKSRGS